MRRTTNGRQSRRRSLRKRQPHAQTGPFRGDKAEYTAGYLWVMQWLAQRVGTEIVGDALNEFVGAHRVAIGRDLTWELTYRRRSQDFITGVYGFLATVARTFAAPGVGGV